jgi:hypothetical protein
LEAPLMPRTCTICAHPKRGDIDAAMLAGTSLRDIAGQYGTSKSNLDRHRDHIPAALTKAKAAAEVAAADTLLAQVIKHRDDAAWFVEQAREIVEEAREAKNTIAAIEAIKSVAPHLREAKGALELLGRVTGELQDKAAIQIDARSVTLMSDRELLELVEAEARKQLGRA